MNKFSERLKELREEKGFTLRELAQKINVSATAINRWEKGLRTANVDTLYLLCKFFGCTADYLIGLEN